MYIAGCGFSIGPTLHPYSCLSFVPAAERCSSFFRMPCTLWASIFKSTGNPLLGLMGSEEPSDPFSPARAPPPPAQLHGRRLRLCLVNYKPGPCIYVTRTHRSQENPCPKLPGWNWGMDGGVFRLVIQAEGEAAGMGTAINLKLESRAWWREIPMTFQLVFGKNMILWNFCWCRSFIWGKFWVKLAKEYTSP